MDLSFDRTLKQTAVGPQTCSIQPEVPLSLLPDLSQGLNHTLQQHGAVLELPPRPSFTDIQVTSSAISLQWEVVAEGTDVANDRTLTYSLHCFADVPFKMKAKLSFKKRFVGTMVTPESGFEELSELSSESKNTFPSLPPSSLGSRNISLVTLGDKSHDQNPTTKSAESSHDKLDSAKSKADKEHGGPTALVLQPAGGKTITSLLPEPIRLPQPTDDTKLPQLVIHPVPGKAAPQPTNQNSTTAVANTQHVVSKVLNLPPLIVGSSSSKRGLDSDSSERLSISTSGGGALGGDSPMSTLGEEEDRSHHHGSSSLCSDSSEEEEEEEVGGGFQRRVNAFSDVGRFCHGYSFEEIYRGEQPSFQYSGMLAGASYYFRVCCHNASGWGPSSDTVKCTTVLT